MLGQKLADAATVALRCLWLALHDYDVQTFEFIDPEETPKNLMIRAVKRKAPRAKEEKIALQKAYDDACTLLGCTPYLARTQDVWGFSTPLCASFSGNCKQSKNLLSHRLTSLLFCCKIVQD